MKRVIFGKKNGRRVDDSQSHRDLNKKYVQKVRSVIFRKRSKKRNITYTSVLLIVVIATTLFINKQGWNQTDTSGTGTQGLRTEKGIAFKPLVPEEAFKKGIRPKYDTEKNTVSFTDSIDTASLTVSQQYFPGSVSLDTVMEGIKGIKNNVLTDKGNAIVATDIETQQQTVVFKDNEVLVFIRTPQILEDSDWILYIGKLTTAP